MKPHKPRTMSQRMTRSLTKMSIGVRPGAHPARDLIVYGLGRISRLGGPRAYVAQAQGGLGQGVDEQRQDHDEPGMGQGHGPGGLPQLEAQASRAQVVEAE